MGQLQICSVCGKPGLHYDYVLRGFTCQFVDDKKVIIYDPVSGNEAV